MAISHFFIATSFSLGRYFFSRQADMLAAREAGLPAIGKRFFPCRDNCSPIKRLDKTQRCIAPKKFAFSISSMPGPALKGCFNSRLFMRRPLKKQKMATIKSGHTTGSAVSDVLIFEAEDCITDSSVNAQHWFRSLQRPSRTL